MGEHHKGACKRLRWLDFNHKGYGARKAWGHKADIEAKAS